MEITPRPMRSNQTPTICTVCDLLDNDKTEKPCVYCKICDAHLCDACRINMPRRAKAMFERSKNK